MPWFICAIKTHKKTVLLLFQSLYSVVSLSCWLTHTQILFSQSSSGTWTKWQPVCSVKSQAFLSWSISTTLILDVLVSPKPAYLWLRVPRALWDLPSFTLGGPGLHQGTPRHTETLLWQSQLEQRLNTGWFCVCVSLWKAECSQHEKEEEVELRSGSKLWQVNAGLFIGPRLFLWLGFQLRLRLWSLC